MRIALISDIHANLPALEAVLEEIDTLAPEAVFHLGDLVGYAPWPNEVVELLEAEGIRGVAGNYDSTVAAGYDHCGCRYESDQQAQLAHRSYEWTRAAVSERTRANLAALPFRLDLRPGGGHRSGAALTLVHGTPTLNTLYWTEDRGDAFCRRMAHAAGARRGDVIAFGHTHLPWTRTVDGIRLVNTGSVGRPKDGDPRAGYVLMNFDGDVPGVEFHRVEYDLERAVLAIEDSDLPDEFARYLVVGGATAGDGTADTADAEEHAT